MSNNKWPAWYYGPKGEAAIFQEAGEVPEGWTDSPSGGAGPEETKKASKVEPVNEEAKALTGNTRAALVQMVKDAGLDVPAESTKVILANLLVGEKAKTKDDNG